MADKKLKQSAEELRSKGRGGDSILAHINPHEAAILKMMGGAGSKNPYTGLPEFLNITDSGGTTVATGGALPPDILPASDVARLAARPAGQSAVGGGFFGGLDAKGFADIAPVWLAVAVPIVGAEIGVALMESGVMTSAAQASAAATASGATAAQAAAAGVAATQAATTVGTAVANATRMVALGSSVGQAIADVSLNAVVNSQIPGIAKQIDSVVKNPAVTNLVASTAASIVKTVAAGGSEADVLRNARAGLVGSGVSSATGSNVAGATVGGGIAGGVAGAFVGAAGAIGSDSKKTGADTATSVSGVDPGVQVAGGDDSSALNLAKISAMPEMLGKAGETSSQISASTDSDGITTYRRSITGTTPDGNPYGYVVTYDPGAPQGKQISYETGYVAGPEGNLVDPSGGAGVSVAFKRPDFTATDTSKTGGAVAGEGLVILGDKGTGGGSSVSPADQKVLDLIKPTPTPGQATVAGPAFTPAIFTPATAPGRGVETDEERIARLDAQTARVIAQEADYTARSRPGTGTGGGNVVVGPGDEGGGPGGNVTIDAGGGGGNATSNVSGNVVVDEPPGEEVAPPGEEDKPPEEEKPPAEEDEKPPEEEDKPPGEKEEPYKPDLFIYSGKTPKPRPRTNLGTTLQAPFAPSTTLGQALTGYRGAGEIEGKKTGKPRREVWNEESLRLKDALGL